MIEQTYESRSTKMNALVYSPAGHEDDGRFILYLHGAGGFGTGIEGLYEYPDLPGLLRDGLRLTSSVIIPSCHMGTRWQPAMISAFIDDFEKDCGRLDCGYDVLGYSRGGSGAYDFAASDPRRVRTLAVVSTRAAPQLAPLIAEKPILICHGSSDQRHPPSEAQLMYDALWAQGCRCQIMLVEGDHFIIARVLSEGAIFEWQRNAI